MGFNWNNIWNLAKNQKNLTTVGISDIIIKSISSIFWFYMATLLSPEQYGEINYLVAIAGIGSTISSLGAATTLTVYVAKGIKIQPAIYFLAIIGGIISSIILFVLYDSFVLSILLMGHLIFVLGMSEILGRKLYILYSKFIIIQNLLMVGLSLGFYFLIGYQGVVLGIGISYFIYSIRIYKGFRESKINFSILKERITVIGSNYALNLVGAFSSSVDRLITAPMLGFALLGNYAIGLQVISVITIIPSNVYRYILPQDSSGVSTIKLKKITITVTVGIVILAIILAPVIMPIMFPKFTESVQIIQIMSLSVIPNTIGAMYNSKLLGTERSIIVLIGSGIYLIVSAVGILSLGSIFGINGVAATLVVSAIVQMSFLIIMYKKDRFFKKMKP